jgi:hypothetical protein
MAVFAVVAVAETPLNLAQEHRWVPKEIDRDRNAAIDWKLCWNVSPPLSSQRLVLPT